MNSFANFFVFVFQNLISLDEKLVCRHWFTFKYADIKLVNDYLFTCREFVIWDLVKTALCHQCKG